MGSAVVSYCFFFNPLTCIMTIRYIEVTLVLGEFRLLSDIGGERQLLAASLAK